MSSLFLSGLGFSETLFQSLVEIDDFAGRRRMRRDGYGAALDLRFEHGEHLRTV